MCFWGTPEFKKVINVIVHLHIGFKSLQMLLSLRTHLPLQHQLHQILTLKCYQFLDLNHLSILSDLHSHRVVLSSIVIVLLMDVDMLQLQRVLLPILRILFKKLPLLFLMIQVLFQSFLPLLTHLILQSTYLLLFVKLIGLLLICIIYIIF